MTTRESQTVELILELVRTHEDDNANAHKAICDKIDELKKLIYTHCEAQKQELLDLKESMAQQILDAERKAIEEAPGKVAQGFRHASVSLRSSAAYIALLLSLVVSILLIVEKVSGL